MSRGGSRQREHDISVRWSADAELDVVEIFQYIAQESPAAARTILTTLQARTHALRDFPRRGRVVPELKRIGIDAWREIIVSHYRVIYTSEVDTVEIDAVIDSRRDIEALLFRRLMGETRP